MMNKKIIYLVTGIIIAAVAVFLINQKVSNLQQIVNQLTRQGRLATVIVAAHDIPKETIIKARMLRRAKVPTKTVSSGVIRDPGSVIGKVARVDIMRNQYIYTNMLRLPRQANTLAQRTPRGKRAVTVDVDIISAVGGLIKPLDHVDVIGIINIPQNVGGKTYNQQLVLTLFQNIEVLAAQRTKSKVNITLALTADEAKLLRYVLQIGKIELALRAPLDMSKDATPPVSYETLMRKIYEMMGVNPNVAPKPKKKEIEVYKGGERE